MMYLSITVHKNMNFDDQFQEKMEAPAHSFQITRSTKRQKITPETHPQILQMDGVYDKEVPETTVQAHFFNRENENNDYKFVSPWDYEYVKNLMHRTPISNFNMNSFHSISKMRDSIEGVSRAHEESFLCEPTGDQRPCVMEEQCEGRFIPGGHEGFTLREFLLPSQLKIYEETKRYPLKRSPCIMCKRLLIARIVIGARAKGTGMREDCLVQDYYNFVDIPGEYPLSCTILSKRNVFEGLVSPVVLHVRNAYKFAMEGKRVYKQWKFPFLTERPGATSGATSHF